MSSEDISLNLNLNLLLSMSPSNGKVLAGTPIAVDFWSLRSCPASVQLFFLTHMHADHITGLRPSWNCPIYCTPVTKKLLLHKLQVANLHIFDLCYIAAVSCMESLKDQCLVHSCLPTSVV